MGEKEEDKPRVPKELSCFGTGSSRVRWGSFMATDLFGTLGKASTCKHGHHREGSRTANCRGTGRIQDSETGRQAGRGVG